LSHVRKVAEQSPTADRWKALPDYIVAKIIPRRHQKLLENCALNAWQLLLLIRASVAPPLA